MHEGVATGVARVLALGGIQLPAEFLFNRQEPYDTGRSFPGIALGVAKERLAGAFGGREHQLLDQRDHRFLNRNLASLLRLGRVHPPHHAAIADLDVISGDLGQLTEGSQPGMYGSKQKIPKTLFGCAVDRLFILRRDRLQTRLRRRFLQPLQWVWNVEHLFGVIEGSKDHRDDAAMCGGRAPAGVAFDPSLEVAFLELRYGQRAAVAAQVVEVGNRAIVMAAAHATSGQPPFARLEVFRADSGNKPFLIDRGLSFSWHRTRQLGPRQGVFGKLAIPLAPDPLSLLVEEGHAFLGAREGKIPGIGLLPVPGRAVRLSSLFARSAHRWILV